MPRGGARPNSGPKKGTKYGPQQETVTKEQHREAHRSVIAKYAHRMLKSQVAAAIGIGHVYSRDKTGKFTRIENEEKADELLTQGVEGQDYWIFMKDPSTAAFADLMNRAFDKPKEQEQELAVRGKLVIQWEE